jgi:AraC-like DNA-binding protein
MTIAPSLARSTTMTVAPGTVAVDCLLVTAMLLASAWRPQAWIARERVRLAQRLLETTDLPVEAIARDCGLGSAANLRKHFARALTTSPQAYRRTFAANVT